MKHVLILEDRLEVLAALLLECDRLEQESGVLLRVTVYSTATDVIDFVNPQAGEAFDAIVLDRNCKRGDSFHIIDLEHFGPDKIISISSLPRFNAEVRARGVSRSVEKGEGELGSFAAEVVAELAQVLKL
ncbi:MAG: hypothetical protein WD467_02465 [Candidatus Saccharimonadales bacterium]